jgi:hypothetical protein
VWTSKLLHPQQSTTYPDILGRAIREHAIAFVKKPAISPDATSGFGTRYIDLIRTFGSSSVSVSLAYTKAAIYGPRENFFSDAELFACAHELAHLAGMLSPGGVMLDELSKRAHKIIFYILVAERLSREQKTKLWEDFVHQILK